MLLKTVYKSRAICAGAVILAVLLVISVYPLRLWRKTVSFEGSGKPLVMSSHVAGSTQVSQVFVAQYDRIGSIDIYVAEITGGRYLDLTLRSSDGETICHRMVDMLAFEQPGYVRMNVGIDVEVGKQYRLYLQGHYAGLHFGLEPVAANPVPYMGAFFYGYDPDPSLRLQISMNYDVPAGKGISLAAIAAICAVCALLCLAVTRFYEKRGDRDRLLLASTLIERTLYVIAGAVYLTVFIFNFPMKKFHDRPGEILWLGIGITLAALLTFYAICRLCTTPAGKKMPLRDMISAGLLCIAIGYACEYMNGVYNLMHDASARQMAVCLLGMMVVSFRTEYLFRRISLAWLALSGAGALYYVNTQTALLAPDADPLHVTVIQCNALIVMLAGLIAICGAHNFRTRIWRRPALSVYAWLSIVTAIVLIVFRNTRMWGVVLFVLFGALFLCVRKNIGAMRFSRIVTWGVNINFLVTWLYCLFFRAFQAFIFTRYGMVFHTVAVTGEYLSSVTLLAAAQLLLRLMQADGNPLRLRVREAWREVFLFALSGVYAVFTISRTAYLSIATGILALFVLSGIVTVMRTEKGRVRALLCHLGTAVAVMVCACALMFPAAFAMQRIVPAMIGRHHAITYLEGRGMVHDLSGSARWDSTYYITGIRFWSIFRGRILRLPELTYPYPEDKLNYDETGTLLYNWDGTPRVIAEIQETDTDGAGADQDATETPSAESAPQAPKPQIDPSGGESKVEVSNGRLDIYRDYIEHLNMTGHDTMIIEGTTYGHAHNSYIQVMYDHGIPAGLLFLLWSIVSVVLPSVLYVKSAIRKEETGEAGMYLSVCALTGAFAVVSLTEMAYHLCNPCAVMMLCAICALMGRRNTSWSE